MRLAAAVALLALLVGIALVAITVAPWPLSYTPPPLPDVDDPEAWTEERIAAARAEGVLPGNEERLVRRRGGDVAILYIHGFGASRAEGEAVVDPLAERLGADVLYARLPGRGVGSEGMDLHASKTFQDYLDVAAGSLAVASGMGDRVIVIGSSTGGLIATWLAAQYPEVVDGLILTSPFYGFTDPVAVTMNGPLGVPIAELLFGDVRDADWQEDPEGRKLEGYDDHWLLDQRYGAVKHLADLRRYVVREETLRAVVAPALLLYYYRDEEHQDAVVSVPAMEAAFASFNDGSPLAESRMAPIADGSHILTSAYVRSDKAAIHAEIDGFLGALGYDLSGSDAPPGGEGGRREAGTRTAERPPSDERGATRRGDAGRRSPSAGEATRGGERR